MRRTVKFFWKHKAAEVKAKFNMVFERLQEEISSWFDVGGGTSDPSTLMVEEVVPERCNT